MRLYALISIASLKPARLVSIVSRFKSSGSANAIECSRKSSRPSFSRATFISSAICSSLVTSIGCRNATCGLPSVSFETRPRFFLRSSSGLSGMYEKPHPPPSSRIRSAIAQAIDCLLNTPVIRPRLSANNGSMNGSFIESSNGARAAFRTRVKVAQLPAQPQERSAAACRGSATHPCCIIDIRRYNSRGQLVSSTSHRNAQHAHARHRSELAPPVQRGCRARTSCSEPALDLVVDGHRRRRGGRCAAPRRRPGRSRRRAASQRRPCRSTSPPRRWSATRSSTATAGWRRRCALRRDVAEPARPAGPRPIVRKRSLSRQSRGARRCARHRRAEVSRRSAAPTACETILDITHEWQQTNDMETLLVRMAEAATQMFDADRASIFLWDKPNKTIVGRPALGVEGGELRLPDDAGIVGQVIQTGEPRRVAGDRRRRGNRSRRRHDRPAIARRRFCACRSYRPTARGSARSKLLNKRGGAFTAETISAAWSSWRRTRPWRWKTRSSSSDLLERHEQLVEQAAQDTLLVGDSPAIQAVRSTIRRVADTDLAILILGENGTGKEVVARSLHYGSRRRKRAVHRRQLRVAHRDAARKRTVRPREGRVHRRPRSPGRQIRSRPPAARCFSTRSAT